MSKDPTRVSRFREARRSRAAVYAEQAKDLADGVSENKDAIAKVREQIGVRRWLAAVDDRDTYGEQPSVQVQVNVADIHLDSLRHRMIEASRPLAEALHQVLPFRQLTEVIAETVAPETEGEAHESSGRGMQELALTTAEKEQQTVQNAVVSKPTLQEVAPGEKV